MFEIDSPIDLENESVSREIDPDIIVVFDGDELAFNIACACEETVLQYTNNNTFEAVDFKHKTQFAKFMNGIDFNPDLFDSELVRKAEPVSYAIKTLKSKIRKLCNELKCDEDNIEIYVGGENNFRDDLPLPYKYKGQRNREDRPLLLDALKEYLVKYMKAELVHGMEADDMLTIRMTDGFKSKKKIIAVTIDKDATQCQGWLYNPDSKKLKFIKGLGDIWIDTETKSQPVKGEGRKFLYYQVLHEDEADHYSSRHVARKLSKDDKAPRFGTKTAYKLLKPCETDKECVELIISQYKKWYGEDNFKYTTWDDKTVTVTYLDLIQMYVDCAYMRTKPDDRLDFRKLCKRLKVKI